MVGGDQTLNTANRSIFPLTMKNGLCYLEQQKPMVWEIKELPRQVMTSIEVWDPLKFKKFDGDYNLNNDKTKLKNNIPPTPMDYSQLPQLIPKTKINPSHSLPYTTGLNNKMKAFSTSININETNTTKSDKESTSNHHTNTNNVRSATFSHPEKITITDGNTGNIISKISHHTTDTVTLHNIGDKTALPPPFLNINTKGIVEQQMLLITASLKDMTIQSPVNKDDDDKKQTSEPRNSNTNDRPTTSCVQPTMCTLPSLAYNDLSP